jgi:hypothetical protein
MTVVNVHITSPTITTTTTTTIFLAVTVKVVATIVLLPVQFLHRVTAADHRFVIIDCIFITSFITFFEMLEIHF